MIAKKSDIAVGTIYTYFKNKEAIIDAIFRIEFEKRKNYLEKIYQKNISSIEKFHQFLDFHFDLLIKDPALSKVLIQESTNPELQTVEGIQKFIQQLPGFFQKILDEGIKKEEIRSLDSSITAYIIFGNIRGIVLNTELLKSEFAIQKVKKELKNYISYALKEA
jgi:TetR/AcrR family fatty acid metabolism transcriptional regulator